MNTNLRQKKNFWPVFIEACKSQWIGGGKRYALNEDKEFTDLVCEVAGLDWIGGNIVKYVGEIINSRKAGEKIQEVNFYKIAVYAFLWWLKHMDIGFTDRDKGEEFKTTNYSA